jgi:pimeloyl-ACP methyl ester carboxylesterase
MNAALTPATAPLHSSFMSRGMMCAATLHRPQTDSTSPQPAILIIHGWGGIQDALTPPFCAAFNELGFAVMTFDYPTWGDSQGLPRNQINPWQRVRDADAALTHLKSQPQIDPRRIVLWGTSFGGGHVIELAAEHTSLLGAIAQVPMMDGRDALLATPLMQMTKIFAHALKDLTPFTAPVYIPVVAPEGQFATMNRDNAYAVLMRGIAQAGIRNTDRYDNRVTARSILNIGLYRPFKKLKQIRVPTLLIGGTRDSVAPFSAQKIDRWQNPYLQYQTLDADHFEPYFEPQLSVNLRYQLDFLGGLIKV